jgi:hypothetical protein
MTRLSTRRGRSASLTAALAMAGLTLFPTAPAQAAAGIEHGTFEISESFDDAEYCAEWGITFHVEMTNSGTFNIVSDVDGNWRFATVSQAQHVTFTANGKTLEEDDHWTNVFYPDGSSTNNGAQTLVKGEDGVVLRDAGRIVKGPDGSVEFIAGKHPQFLGETFCDDLLP